MVYGKNLNGIGKRIFIDQIYLALVNYTFFKFLIFLKLLSFIYAQFTNRRLGYTRGRGYKPNGLKWAILG